jgi:phosphate transport system substrate-binding protein
MTWLRLPLSLITGFALVAGCSRSTSQKQNEGAGDGSKAPTEKPAGRVVLQNKGSDTLVNVAQAWAEAYKKVNPALAIAVTGGGSGTGISALINGTVDLANSSRSISPKEVEAAKKHGVTPKEHTVGFDALAIFLHKDNPIKEFSLEQLADIYGENGKTERWSQLGVKVPGCDSDEIVRVSRQNNSGTYVYFKEAVLGESKEYKFGSRDMHGSKDVVDLVAKTPCAIGYSGLAYATPDVHMPCVKTADGKCVAPSMETAVDRSYPIARPLFMYTSGEPKGSVKEYLDWILTDKGQCIIVDKGYASARPVKCK